MIASYLDDWTVRVHEHGFVRLRNCAGPTRRDEIVTVFEDSQVPSIVRYFDADDVDPAQAARMSFGGMDKERSRDADLKLAAYLMRNAHTSPFEMVQVWLEMKLPIFVARQLVRHRTARLNEISGRYVTLPAEWYVPALEDVVLQSKDRKQGGRPVDFDDLEQVASAIEYRTRLQESCARGYEAYERSVADGVAMEQARLSLSLNHYTRWLWNQDLHNLFHMLSLRDHSHAQPEARAYAQAIDQLVRQVLPECFRLYDEFRRRL